MTPHKTLLATLALAALLGGLLSAALQAPEAFASRNPFIPGGDKQARQQTAPAVPSFVPDWLLQTVVRWQLSLRAQMTTLARDISRNPWGRSFWLFMLASLAYGAAHALGPGHGKAFAMAYFLERPGPPSLGLLFGNLSMFCHVLSAAVLVFAGAYVLKTAAAGLVDDAGATLEGISYALLAGIGLFLFVGRVVALRRKEQEHTAPPKRAGGKSLVATALAAGLVPCPGASLVLLFCISLGIPLAGLAALVAISLGMGATISLFATATILSRTALLRVTHSRGRLLEHAQTAVSLLGGLAMSALGTLLFLGWWWG